MNSLSRYEAAVQSQGHSFFLDREIRTPTGSAKEITFGMLDGQSVVSAKPRIWDRDRKTAEAAKAFFRREGELLAHCKENNVAGILQPICHISYVGKNGETKHRMIFPRYQGDLYDFLDKKWQGLTTQNIQSIAEQLLIIGEELQRKQYIHRDIKPENILWRKKDDGTFKIILCDLGFFRLPDDPTPLQWGGSPAEIAPEYAAYACSPKKTDELLAARTTEKIDAWNIGVLLLYLKDPRIAFYWRSLPPSDCLARNAGWYRHNTELSQDDVIKNLLNPDPAKRWSASQALELFRANRITQAYHEALAFPNGIL